MILHFLSCARATKRLSFLLLLLSGIICTVHSFSRKVLVPPDHGDPSSHSELNIEKRSHSVTGIHDLVGDDGVLLISRTSDDVRFEKTKQRLADVGVHVSRFSATDGTRLTIQEMNLTCVQRSCQHLLHAKANRETAVTNL